VGAAVEAGATLRRVRAQDLERSTWGVRRFGRAATIADRCELLATRLRDDAFFSHTTAALLFGVPLPPAFEGERDLHVAVTAALPTPHARGIRGHRLTVSADEVVTHERVRCTSAARTWCDLGGMLDLDDLVAAGDFLLHWRSPLVAETQLREQVRRFGSGRGARRLREALPLLSSRSESRPESKARVLVVTSGLPVPSVNHSLIDTETGRELRPDLMFVDCRVIVEYQGEHHRSRQQWRRDMTRRAELEARGWYVMEINADDLRDGAAFVRRLETVLRRRGWRG